MAYKIANIQTDSTAIAFNLFESVKNVFDLKSSKDWTNGGEINVVLNYNCGPNLPTFLGIIYKAERKSN